MSKWRSFYALSMRLSLALTLGLALMAALPAHADFPATAIDGYGTPVKVSFCANVDYGSNPWMNDARITSATYCVPVAAGAADYNYGWSETSGYFGWPGMSFPCGNYGCKTGYVEWAIGRIRVSCPANASVGAGDQCHCNSGYTDSPQSPNSCSILEVTDEALAPQSCPTCDGNPIYPLLGVKREPVHTGIAIGGTELVLLYDSSTALRPPVAGNATALAEPPAFGALWKSNFHHKLQIAVGGKRALLSLGNAQVLTFTGDGAGNFAAYGYNKDKLTTISGGYRLARLDGVVETFDASGNPVTLAKPDGTVLTFTYSGNFLQTVQSNEGRILRFGYTGNLITTIRAPDYSVTAAAYDARGNLASLTWADNHARTFLYENSALPWALTGAVDENNSRFSTFTYDSAGHALSTEHSGGVYKFSVSYASAPVWVIDDSFDSASNTVHRKHSWQPPSGTVMTRPNGEQTNLDAQAVIGIPSVTAQSQPAGSGSPSSNATTSYDSSGNVASRMDATGVRTCYTYDANNRETVRLEGATVPCDQASASNSRQVTTSWHPDWQLPIVVTQPLRKTTIVYHGQPDPFNSNAVANCTSAPNRADGKPVPLVCKRVEQSLLANGSVDPSVPARSDRYTYDAAGRVLTHTDAKNSTANYAYYSSGSFASTNDPYFGNVVLLLHGEGADGSTTLVDSASSPKVFTASGGAQLSAGQHKFGSSAMYLSATGDRFVAASSDDFRWGTGDFTVEGWVYASAYSAEGQIAGMHRYGSDNLWLLSITSAGKLHYYNAVGTNQVSVATVPIGSWHHVAVSRAGGVNRLFIDGVLDSTWTDTLNYAGYSYGLTIGGDYTGNANAQFKGYIDDLRITKGVARYTATFAPGAAPFPDAGLGMNALGHTQGDLQTVTNTAGQVTQYTQYDPAGRVRQMIDLKGIIIDISYTPRGLVSAVTVTPPAGTVRTTTYTYDNAGQMTAVSLPDGTSLAYTYDAAHRLTGVTDTLGNSVSYTLDAAGNRTGEDMRDATGTLRRSIARSFDALNRLQQVNGAAQ